MERSCMEWLLRGQELRHVIQIMACGGMIGSAILFPLANLEGLQFRALTLSIFVLSAVAFHGLRLEPFERFGLFTVAVALVLLLVAVLSAGSSRRELIPWVPLFITCSSLITVAIYELSQQTRARSIPQGVEEEFSGVSIDTWSDRSLRTVSGPLEPGLPFESTRFNPLYFALQGPSPRTSQRTSTNATELSLGSVAGRCRPQWDSQTRSFFPDDLPELGAQGGPHSGDSQGYENSQDPDPDSGSEHGTVNQPVLC